MTLALSAALLIFGGVYLVMRREMLRIALGFMLLSHGANLVLMAAGGTGWRNEPFGTHTDEMLADAADPLPQAFVLTAIVIAFSISVVMLVSAVVGRGDSDHTRALEEEETNPDQQDEEEEMRQQEEAALGSSQEADK